VLKTQRATGSFRLEKIAGLRLRSVLEEAVAEGSSRMPTVMVVDDSRFQRMMLSKVIKQQGHEVLEAADGDEAVSMYGASKPDLALMDVTMPNKDGLQALEEIRGLDPSARVVMLTALDQDSVVVKAIELGAKDFLAKPVPPERLVSTLQKILG